MLIMIYFLGTRCISLITGLARGPMNLVLKCSVSNKTLPFAIFHAMRELNSALSLLMRAEETKTLIFYFLDRESNPQPVA